MKKALLKSWCLFLALVLVACVATGAVLWVIASKLANVCAYYEIFVAVTVGVASEIYHATSGEYYEE